MLIDKHNSRSSLQEVIPQCKLLVQTNLDHIQILIAGFQELKNQGRIKVDIQTFNQSHFEKSIQNPHLLVEVNGSKLLLFDCLDFGNINDQLASNVDFYFKRSFSREFVGQNLAYKKIFPLGLNYRVEGKFPSLLTLRCISLEKTLIEKSHAFIHYITAPLSQVNPRFFRMDFDHCSAPPDLKLPPSVIFVAKLWDPALTLPKYRPERELINNIRAETIRKLKNTFKDYFFGGVIPNDYARRYFPDCLVSDPQITRFGNYIQKMRQYPIGVATTGLHNSIGWKFAEYVAFSHAVVSERLHYEAPGLMKETHYLEFTTPDECVEAVGRLMDDRQLRTEMMEANHIYYENYLRPDKLVWNALEIALNA